MIIRSVIFISNHDNGLLTLECTKGLYSCIIKKQQLSTLFAIVWSMYLSVSIISLSGWYKMRV